MKRKALLVMAIMCLFGILASTEVAFAGWCRCKITEAGMDSTNVVYIRATSNDQTWPGERYFLASGDQAKTYLAIALAAISSGFDVYLSLNQFEQWSPCGGVISIKTP